MGLEGGSDKAKDMSRRGFLRAAGKTAAGLGAMYAADKLGMIGSAEAKSKSNEHQHDAKKDSSKLTEKSDLQNDERLKVADAESFDSLAETKSFGPLELTPEALALLQKYQNEIGVFSNRDTLTIDGRPLTFDHIAPGTSIFVSGNLQAEKLRVTFNIENGEQHGVKRWYIGRIPQRSNQFFGVQEGGFYDGNGTDFSENMIPQGRFMLTPDARRILWKGHGIPKRIGSSKEPIKSPETDSGWASGIRGIHAIAEEAEREMEQIVPRHHGNIAIDPEKGDVILDGKRLPMPHIYPPDTPITISGNTSDNILIISYPTKQGAVYNTEFIRLEVSNKAFIVVDRYQGQYPEVDEAE